MLHRPIERTALKWRRLTRTERTRLKSWRLKVLEHASERPRPIQMQRLADSSRLSSRRMTGGRTLHSDGHLVRRTLSGDGSGFGELHRRYYERVLRVVSGILKDRGRAEEEVQEAYLEALDALPRLTDGERFYPWLRRIAVNRAIEVQRRARRRERILGENLEVDPGSTLGTALEDLIQAETARRVRRAIDRLPEGQRAAVVLRFFDGLRTRDIAAVLGCEAVTARTQLFRGLRRLGVLIREEEP